MIMRYDMMRNDMYIVLLLYTHVNITMLEER